MSKSKQKTLMKLEQKYSNLKHQREKVIMKLQSINEQLKKSRGEVRAFKAKWYKSNERSNINITVHAVLRYVERVLNINVDQYRNQEPNDNKLLPLLLQQESLVLTELYDEMLPEALAKAIPLCGDNRYKVKTERGEFDLKVANDTIITVLT